MPLETVQAEAASKAEKLAQVQLPEDAVLVATHFQTEILPDQNTVRVRAIIETVESIGEFVALTEE